MSTDRIHATASREGGFNRECVDRLTASLPSSGWRTRFAPAPTGFLHMGHLVNALYVWGIARAFGGAVLLRIEDHDRTRCRPEYETALLDDLDWLGLVPDDGSTQSYRDRPAGHALRQSNNHARYEAALARLDDIGVVYPCECSRREMQQQSPRRPGEELRYSGRCRDRGVSPRATLARRVRLEPGNERFDDLRLGTFVHDPSAQCGDLLARDRHGGWTYQFAVTVDDAVHNVDLVIRGEDLLASTARQQRLARLLGRPQPPRFLHHPLLVHADGTKLSKANHDTALAERRASGEKPEALLGQAAHLIGLAETDQSLSADDLPALFDRRRFA